MAIARQMSSMPPGPNTVRTWLLHRRYAVPTAMIDAATGCRLSGDWQGACAAAHVTPDIDLRAVEREHGAQVAAMIEDDLRHLAPDLLRWHEPLDRHYSWSASSEPVPMTRLAGGAGLHLVQGARQGHRRPFRLRVGVSRGAPLIDRHLWDVRQAPLLHTLCGPEPVGTDAVCPHTTGRQREAAAAAGIDATALAEPTSQYSLAGYPLVWSRLVPAALALLARHRSDAGMVDLGEGWLDLRARPTVIATPELRDRPPNVPLLQLSDWQEPLDAELVRHGLLDPDALHPLVHAGLLPGRTQTRRPWVPPVPAVVTIDCGGRTHRLAARDGRWHPLDHEPGHVARETVLAALGGPIDGCADALLHWQAGGQGLRMLPPPVQHLHDELWMRVHHGDTDGVLRLLDAGLPPAVERNGATLMHALRSLDHARVLPRLLALGLDVNARTRSGATPLHTALAHPEAGTDLIAALLRAGADPRATNDQGERPAELSRNPSTIALLDG
ncbi:ankyrin repeat domain-containing protein [Dactylosporangium siamense]